ncbi:hypothetical protein KKA53_01505 [Candidatus Dependentiae bacterium]|nr:hypothetical protein [Candidatus Dependentiae bacterium]
MNKKILLFVTCFLFGSAFAQNYFCLRLQDKKPCLFWCIYEDKKNIGVYEEAAFPSSCWTNDGFAVIPLCWNKLELALVQVLEPAHDCYGMNSSFEKSNLRCTMLLDKWHMQTIKTLGSVCCLVHDRSGVETSITASFDIKKDRINKRLGLIAVVIPYVDRKSNFMNDISDYWE